MPEHPLSALREIDPKFMELLGGLDDSIYGNGALPRKVKLLIALAFDAANGADQGVRSLAKSAIQEGATLQEIAEAVRVAFHLSGVGSLYTASKGLKDLV
jgi:alkylhydroperoxidase/carboxymuconolactone decarboxylase family protein YurZ